LPGLQRRDVSNVRQTVRWSPDVAVGNRRPEAASENCSRCTPNCARPAVARQARHSVIEDASIHLLTASRTPVGSTLAPEAAFTA